MSDDLKKLENLLQAAKSEASGFVFRLVDKFNHKKKSFEARFGTLIFGRGWEDLDKGTFYSAFKLGFLKPEPDAKLKEEVVAFVDEFNESLKFLARAGIATSLLFRGGELHVSAVTIEAYSNATDKATLADRLATEHKAFLGEDVKIEVQSAEGSA